MPGLDNQRQKACDIRFSVKVVLTILRLIAKR